MKRVYFALGGVSALLLLQPSNAADVSDAKLLRVAEKLLPDNSSRPCEHESLSYPGWTDFPVKLCTYSDVGMTVHTYMLNPTVQQMARWTVSACLEVASKEPDRCVTALARQISGQSTGVFPVAGYIPEPADSSGGHGKGALCNAFRDGVTVVINGRHSMLPTDGKCPEGQLNTENDKVTSVMRFARVASTTREEYCANGGQAAVGKAGTSNIEWMNVIRQLYQAAWKSDRNELLTAKARSWMQGQWPVCSDPKTKKVCEADRVTTPVAAPQPAPSCPK